MTARRVLASESTATRGFERAVQRQTNARSERLCTRRSPLYRCRNEGIRFEKKRSPFALGAAGSGCLRPLAVVGSCSASRRLRSAEQDHMAVGGRRGRQAGSGRGSRRVRRQAAQATTGVCGNRPGNRRATTADGAAEQRGERLSPTTTTSAATTTAPMTMPAMAPPLRPIGAASGRGGERRRREAATLRWGWLLWRGSSSGAQAPDGWPLGAGSMPFTRAGCVCALKRRLQAGGRELASAAGGRLCAGRMGC